MPILEVAGQTYETDEAGYLIGWISDPSKRTAVTTHLAAQESVEMGPNHWEVIYFVWAYYEEYKIAPLIRILTKVIGKKLGKEKVNSKYFYTLFPGGIGQQAYKIAAIPRPRNGFCI